MWTRERPHDQRENLFGGRGAVRVWDLSSDGLTAPFTAVLGCELERSGRVGRHLQSEFSEIVVVIEGRGIARVQSEPIELGPGRVVALPRGQTLAIENGSSEEPLRYLIVKAASSSG